MRATRTIACLFLLGALVRAEPETLRLGWGHSWLHSYISNQFKAYRTPPEGVDALDEEDLWYVSVELAPGKFFLAAADTLSKTARAWVDLDLDGQLTDEKPIDLENHGARVHTRFEFAWRDSKEAKPHTLPAMLTFDRGLKDGHVWLRLLGHREAQVIIEGRLRWVATVSGNADRLVDDEKTDQIYIDLDGDGRITTGLRSHERVQPGRVFRIGAHGYRVRLREPTGATLLIERADPAPAPRARPWPRPIRPRGRRRFIRYTSTSETLDELKRDFEARRASRGSFFGPEDSLRQIGCLGSADAVKFLILVARKDKDPDLRRIAIEALDNQANRPHAKRIVAAARKSRDPESATTFARVLGWMEAPDRHALWYELLGSTRHDEVRAVCADLFVTGNETGRKKLQESVGSWRNAAVDYHAYRASTRSRPTAPPAELLTRALKSKDARLRLLVWRDVQWLGMRDARPHALAIANEARKRKRVDAEMARVVVELLGPVAGPEEVPALLGVVHASTPETRNQLVDLLRLVRDDATCAAIRAELGNRDPDVREVAVRALAGIPDKANVPALAEQLAREPEASVRMPLVTALGQVGAKDAAKTIVGLASRRKKDPELAEAAVIAAARIGLDVPAVAAFFRRCESRQNWVERLDAVDAVARYGGTSAVPFLVRQLTDGEWRVRVAAAQGLGRIRVKEAIGALIGRLEKEEDRRARRAVADALFRITGQHLYDLYELWVKWWSRNHANFVVPDTIPQKKERKGGRKTVASFYGIPVESEQVVFVIDNSGSMGGFGDRESELDRAVKETLKVIGKLKDGARVNVVFFESDVQSWSDKLVKLNKTTRPKLKAYLESQRPQGGTNLYDALELAIGMPDLDTIYLLSDGMPGSGKFVAEEDIVREIGKLNRRLRVEIHGISIGTESSLLKKLAEQSGGTYTKR